MNSNDPYDHPIIIPNAFKDPADFLPFVEAFKFGKQWAAALSKYNATIVNIKDPGCSQYHSGKVCERSLLCNAFMVFKSVFK